MSIVDLLEHYGIKQGDFSMKDRKDEGIEEVLRGGMSEEDKRNEMIAKKMAARARDL